MLRLSGMRRQQLAWFTILLLLLCKSASCLALVTINEVMANVKGPENRFGYYNEFVEMFNLSSDSVNLSGWKISDGDAVDYLIPWSDSLGSLDPGVLLDTYVIPGNRYCLVLDRDYASAPDSEGYMPYQFISGTIILTTKNSAIGNGLSTTDPVILINQYGDTVDTYGTPWDGHDSLPFDPGDGVSVERVFPGIPDQGSNWSACVWTSGSTPGDQNSVTPYMGVGLSWKDMRISPEEPLPGEDVQISATIHNRSIERVSNVEVVFYIDTDWNARPDPEEMLETVTVEGIGPLGGTAETIVRWQSVPEACHRVGVQVLDSVCAFRVFRAGEALGDAVVNEIMFDSDRSGEWVEIYNRSGHSLNLTGCTVADASRSCTICGTDLILGSGGFALICADTAALYTEYLVSDCIVLEPDGFPSLNNQGDSMVLSDVTGFVYDRLYYEGDWGVDKNTSLERVSSEVASDERANWSRCVSPEGATPGLENSIHAVVGHNEAILSLSPNPFSPDGDGLDDRAVISYQFPFSVANLRVLVYDRGGRIVRRILGGGEVAGKGDLLWDGRDDTGSFLPVGIYLIYAEASDIITRRKLSSKATVVLARRLD